MVPCHVSTGSPSALYGGYRGRTRRGLVDTQVRSETGGTEGANGLSPMGKGVTVPEGGVKTGSSWSGTDERGKCDNIRLSAACLSNEGTICSMVVVVA